MKTNLKIDGVFANQSTCDDVLSIASRIDGISFTSHIVGEGWDFAAIGKTSMPDMLVYELTGQDERELIELEGLVNEHKGRLSVYVTSKDGDVDIVRRLMRAGVKDALPQPIQSQELLQAITNEIALKRERIRSSQGERGGVTAFVNAKGGCGATTLAVNVAHMLAKEYKAKVALIDLDIQFGAAALMLDLEVHSTVMDALLQPERIDPVFLEALMTKHESGLDVLAAPADMSSMTGIAADSVKRLLDAAVENYDYVILDVPRVITPWSLEALHYAEPVMVVGQNSLLSIRDAKILLDRMPHEGISLDKVELVNNRAMAKGGSVSIEKLKETLGKKLIHRVRNDFKTAAQAQDEGRPIVAVSKHSDFTKDVHALAEYLVKAHRGESKHSSGLLGRLFGHKD